MSNSIKPVINVYPEGESSFIAIQIDVNSDDTVKVYDFNKMELRTVNSYEVGHPVIDDLNSL